MGNIHRAAPTSKTREVCSSQALATLRLSAGRGGAGQRNIHAVASWCSAASPLRLFDEVFLITTLSRWLPAWVLSLCKCFYCPQSVCYENTQKMHRQHICTIITKKSRRKAVCVTRRPYNCRYSSIIPRLFQRNVSNQCNNLAENPETYLLTTMESLYFACV